MADIKQMLKTAEKEGYKDENAEAKICQDIILMALSKSPLCRNATIKGGVVMRSLSRSARRATQDMDIDFIRYSISDDSVMHFIEKLNCVDGIHIQQVGHIEELKQQDYHGKRIYIKIMDDNGNEIESKIDLGVHKNLTIKQEEYCFDISSFDEGANLLINSKEQMFTEKLKSLLKFGRYSTRYKDIFDMCYLSEMVERKKLAECFREYIYDDPKMRENSIQDITARLKRIFNDQSYIRLLNSSRKNWLEIETEDVLIEILDFIENNV